ncbi:Magnesium and cobalt efflux protein CorC [Poriferisphaera corsica]|uniref:Magnesium and cobalt efflux protein CorC n=1 Tax=Poriferisphaera corsica TaxID=2528020 RepID=A0A517YV71_9BACT|nr:hemolysin family protein [Poriferisphaera corsica]QDU34106.1 Magnesium and cobalt efflux protein CorC [Poriferisphaera corsica]
MQSAIIIASVSCLLTCYFAAIQVALRAYSKRKLGDLLKSANTETRLESFSNRIPKMLMVTGILRTAFSMIILLASFYFGQYEFPTDAQFQYVSAFIIGGILLIIFNVAIPSSWGTYKPEWLLSWSIPILSFLTFIFTPVIAILSIFDPIVRRISGVDLEKDYDPEIAEEVLSTIEQHDESDTVDEEQKEMLEAILDISDTDAGEVMTPRTDVHGISVSSTLEQARDAIITFGHSRIPVYQDNLDNILGILYAKDLIKYVDQSPSDFNLKNIIRDPLLIPESKTVRDLLAEFKAQKIHLAIVIDEYGGTAGIVTVEDIVEEIIGDIQDEYELEEEPQQIIILDSNTANIDARTHIDDINDQFDIELPEDEDYDTIGGYVFSSLGHIPNVGEQFDFENLRFTVTAAERTKVLSIRLERLTPDTKPLDQ